MTDTDQKKIDELLTRGVDQVITADRLNEDLLSGRTLRIKLGIDPTSPNLHIGRSATLLKLRDFQALGHTIVFIVGDFTGLIGDTSDKESERPMLSEDQIEENKRNYFTQAGKIIDLDKAETRYNSEWLGTLTYKEIGRQANHFSVADFIARDNIKRRLEDGKRVSLREVLYPLMQGYDSVAIQSDVELGGSDQWFNLLAGRTLQESAGQKPQNIITMKLLMGLDGRKMSSSWGNTINVTDEPHNMFGKVMSMRDEHMIDYFVSCTRVSLHEIDAFRASLRSNSVNPRDIKMRLARELVTLYHSKEDAREAEKQFTQTFQEHTVPNNIPIIQVARGTSIGNALLNASVVSSKNEFRRLIDEGAITNTDTHEKMSDSLQTVSETVTLKVGKKRFIKIEIR